MPGKIRPILQTNGIITGKDQIKTIAKEPKELELKHLHSGKVRETFEVDDATLLIITTDRWSAYDVKMPQGIPLKGKILNTMSVLNFMGTEQIIQNHLITSDMTAFEKSRELKKAFENSAEFLHVLNGRSMLVKKAKPLPFEFVVRGFLYGSGLDDYNNNDGTVSGVKLPLGLVKASKLQEPIFTPATKAQVGHDENVTYEYMEKKLGSDVAATLKEKSIALYKNRAEFALEKGLILADTKFEFGYIGGELALIDEVVTPDSSRLWPRRSYKEGFDQDSCNDKQYLRDYLIKVANWGLVEIPS
ncbi:MAG: phosphoribosylaminoimidazolesuccinocarboxamide synthase [Candidatus Micrarchaeota archaeon]|nr:phosphoribosylaminoimidazolesuccinocarboxamide synthase [Candidatus Micrarchaeota archaeon]MDE1848375.1 phosphoribosylaminoimidazolesuccinocarboxamide synthase [Candidatus Micrarchaeota archaeon]MDE1864981.1 phosphoribosylaminoimidazolesuccinocarboxamide synthase [Candidatus Micrarchaeota archaeon]